MRGNGELADRLAAEFPDQCSVFFNTENNLTPAGEMATLALLLREKYANLLDEQARLRKEINKLYLENIRIEEENKQLRASAENILKTMELISEEAEKVKEISNRLLLELAP